ncbi:MAG: peroxiredoxin [bacterium]
MHEDSESSPQILNRPLLLDRPVPTFIARSTQGTVTLDNYRGRWLIMFAHPADFTPVCTSEFIALQRAYKEFEMRGCALLGLSVDSIYAHVAWVRNIKEKFGVEINFPIVEDISMAISSAYGMLDGSSNSTATVRAVFFIDPSGILRAKIFYPMQVGRSVAEIIRVLSALQSSDEHKMSAPEGWKPGEKLVPMAPTTLEEANSISAMPEMTEWYYTESKTIN